MKSVLALFALAMGLMLGHGQALAEDAAPVSQTAPVPDLAGTWTGPFKVIRAHGVSEGTFTLRVLEQDRPLLKGEKPGRPRAPRAMSRASMCKGPRSPL